MRILFLGGGTGGHFYPLIAVAESIYDIAKTHNYVVPKMYYIGPEKLDEKALYDNNIKYIYCSAGKKRRGGGISSSLLNFLDLFKTFFGIVKSFFYLIVIYPDVVFSKGGYASFPPLYVCKLLRIPVVIHESDSTTGIVNRWSAKFAKRIAVSYPVIPAGLEKYENKIAFTGVPVRKRIKAETDASGEYVKKTFDLKNNKPVVFVLGGSQGSVTINNLILDSLHELLKDYQVIHQTGKKNLTDVKFAASSVLRDDPNKDSYHIIDFLNNYEMKAAASSASIIVSRAGSGTLFEISEWGLPAIIIPIPEHISHDQKTNAYTYARETGSIVIEQSNLSQSILMSEINRIMSDNVLYRKISANSKRFARPDAAEVIANELYKIILTHL